MSSRTIVGCGLGVVFQQPARSFIERFEHRFGKQGNTFACLVHGVKRSESFGSLYASDRFTFANALTVTKYPPPSVAADRTFYCSSHDLFSFAFRPVLGLPLEALPPSAAIRLLSAFGSFLLRASPSFRPYAERSSGVLPFQRAKAPSLPSACACGFGSFLGMVEH